MEQRKTIEELFDEGTPIDDALADAEYRMALQHRRDGLPIVTLREGKVAHVPAEEVLAVLDRDRAQRRKPDVPAA